MLKKILVYCLILLVGTLVTSCKEEEAKYSEKEIQLGTDEETSFSQISSGEAKTKYGYGIVVFREMDETYAIFSIPSTGQNEETSFNLNITTGNVAPYYQIDALNGSSVLVNGISDQLWFESSPNSITPITVSADLEPFQQEIIQITALNSAPVLMNGENSNNNGLDALANHIRFVVPPEERNASKANGAYVIAYPWRTIVVAIEGEATETEKQQMIDYTNETFNQAICKVELATQHEIDDSTFDCRIVLTSNNFLFEGPVGVFDEKGDIYDIYNSNEMKFAAIDYTLSDFHKVATYSIAYLLGVDLDASVDDLQDLVDENLMNNYGREGNYLTFKQWNQLHQ